MLRNRLIILTFLIFLTSCATCVVPKIPVELEPEYPFIDVEKEIENMAIEGTPYYKLHVDTLTKLTKKNAQRRNHIKKLQSQIEAINDQ